MDVIRARDAVRLWTQNLVLVESYIKSIQAELATLLQNDELNTTTPEYNIYETVELRPLEETLAGIKENARVIRVLSTSIDQQWFYRQGFEEHLKPDISIVSKLNLKRAEDKVMESFLLNKPDISVGLQYNFPRENRTTQSNIHQTDLQIERLEKEIDSITLTLSSTVTNLHILLLELENVLVLNQEQIQSAEEKTTEELALYNQGRSNLTFVIQSRDSEQNARFTYAQNALTYHKLILQYRSLLDQLLQ
ncbi:TolC family protein [candidate division KSB1 bacterium]